MSKLQYLMYCAVSGFIYGTVVQIIFNVTLTDVSFWVGVSIMIIFNSIVVPTYIEIERDDE